MLGTAFGGAREFQGHNGDAAGAEEVALAVAGLVGVGQAIADEIAAARVAGGGAVELPFPAQQDVLHEVEQGRFAGAERAGDEHVVRQVDDLAEAVPIDRDDPREGNAPTHGSSSARAVSGAPGSAGV